MNITFIVNSKARGVTELLHQVHSQPQFKEAKTRFTEYRGHGIEQASGMAAWSDLIVAVGGDGTLSEVVNGIMQSNLDPKKRPSLALIPMGSANDFARVQKIPADLAGLIKAISKKSFKNIDIGKIHIISEDRVHYFINVADSGFGAEVVQRLEEKSIFRRILHSDLRFALAILRTFFTYKRKKVNILLDERTPIQGKILTLVVANSKAFGSGLIVAPDARLDDGKFRLLVGDISLWGYLMSVSKLLEGNKIKRQGVHYLEASHIEIDGPTDLLIEADGELIGEGKVNIQCIPGAISFLFPEIGSF